MIDERTAAEASRRAAELILQDERLTSDLEDREADALLRWAVAKAEQVVFACLQRGEPVDGAAIAEAVRPVRQVARTINDLVAGHAQMERYEFLAQLLALLDAACRLASETPGRPMKSSSSPSSPSP